MKQYLIEQLEANGIPCREEQADKIVAFHRALCAWNENVNLTNITDDMESVQKHYLDSLQLLKSNISLEGRTIIDVGTGAGFPGLPLAVFCESAHFTLLDSLNKRISFIESVKTELVIKNIHCVHMRSEDAAHKPVYRESFDIALSRAVAKLSILNEYLLPFVKTGGLSIAYKANVEEDEIKHADKSLYILGGGKYQVFDVFLAGSNLTRKLVISQKIKPCPKQYPRKAGLPKKMPIE